MTPPGKPLRNNYEHPDPPGGPVGEVVVMERAKTLLDRVLFWITVVLFAVLVVIVVWQVLSRQVLGAPSTWTEEGARMTFVWLGLFASAFVFGERGHI